MRKVKITKRKPFGKRGAIPLGDPMAVASRQAQPVQMQKPGAKPLPGNQPLPGTQPASPHLYKGTKKPLIITILVVVLIAGLSLLLLFKGQFTGKAFSTGVGGSAGIFSLAPVAPNTEFNVVVKGNIVAAESVAMGFTMSFPDGLTCSSVASNLLWPDNDLIISTAECDNVNNVVNFEYATIDPDATITKEVSNGLTVDDFRIATIAFAGAAEGDYPLTFSSFYIADLQAPHDNLVPNAVRDGGDTLVVAPECLDTDGDEYDNCAPGAVGQLDDLEADCNDDPDDNGASVNPAAAEVCEDGIDNDCDGGDEDCGPRVIDSCGDRILSPGNYVLEEDIGPCEIGISILANNVNLDCNENTIFGSGVNNQAGISLRRDEISVSRCTIDGFGRGMVTNNVLNNRLINNIIKNSVVHGIFILGGSGILIEGNTLTEGNNFGITLQDDADVILNSNVVCNSIGKDFGCIGDDAGFSGTGNQWTTFRPFQCENTDGSPWPQLGDDENSEYRECPVCAPGNLGACLVESGCTSADGYWNGATCQVCNGNAPTCIDANTLQTCNVAGDGYVGNPTNCPNGCANGACVAGDPVITSIVATPTDGAGPRDYTISFTVENFVFGFYEDYQTDLDAGNLMQPGDHIHITGQVAGTGLPGQVYHDTNEAFDLVSNPFTLAVSLEDNDEHVINIQLYDSGDAGNAHNPIGDPHQVTLPAAAPVCAPGNLGACLTGDDCTVATGYWNGGSCTLCEANAWTCQDADTKYQCNDNGAAYLAPVDCADGETCTAGACAGGLDTDGVGEGDICPTSGSEGQVYGENTALYGCLAGDTNGGGCVNFQDVRIISRVVDLTCGSVANPAPDLLPDPLPEGDINGDGCVNFQDVRIISRVVDLECIES
jgi:parallel beta-helix repeat protein